MRNFKHEGICSLDELELILSDLAKCVKLAKVNNNGLVDLKNNIYIRKLNITFKDGYCMSELSYNIDLKSKKDETNEERTFTEST